MGRISPIALAFDVLFHHLLSARRRPFLASYKLTYRCNLRCRPCPFHSLPSPSPTYAEAAGVLDALHQRGCRVVVFEGGEPLLWRDGDRTFSDLARYARERFACVAATTNGTLPLDTPTDVLWVSIDGFAPTHNRLRGEGVFEQVMENIRCSPHPRLYAHITANAENHAEIPALVRFLAGRVRGVTIQFYYPYGADDRLFLPWPARRALLAELIQLKQAGCPLMNSTASLTALMRNTWRCLPWLVACADPDGAIRQGCYLQNRAPQRCDLCGFSPYTELSLAFRLNPQAVLAGMRIFF